MFYLLNRELSFEVDMANMGCGMNAALYFIAMQADGNKPAGYSGAQYGTGYCDAQPAQPDRPSCDEMVRYNWNQYRARKLEKSLYLGSRTSGRPTA